MHNASVGFPNRLTLSSLGSSWFSGGLGLFLGHFLSFLFPYFFPFLFYSTVVEGLDTVSRLQEIYDIGYFEAREKRAHMGRLGYQDV